MRQIKASEVKPGMTVKFDTDGWHVEGAVSRVEPVTFGLDFYSTQGLEMTLGEDTPVTVLAEPAPAQPEEPTEFGARAVVKGRRFLRAPEDKCDVQAWLEEGDGIWRDWDELCAMGPVQVIPDQGWTVPDNTPAVPDRIEEWPENDTALRPYKWRDEYGEIWRYGRNSYVEGWTSGYLFQNSPVYGPWDRVTDA